MSMAEKKTYQISYYDVALPTGITDSWQSQSFFTNHLGVAGLQQGTGTSNRIGNKIFVTHIEYRFTIKPTAGAGMDLSGGNQCRFAIYHNKQCNQAPPVMTSVWAINGVNSCRNPDLLKQYSVSADRIMSMVPTSATTIGPAFPIIGVIRVNKVIEYTSNLATIAALMKDDYGFMVISDKTPCCEIYGQWQIRFTDY
jgi:hypothetical protein